MSSITIKPEGQSLTLSSLTSIPGGATQTAYADAGLTTPVSLPLTIAADTVLWVRDGTVNITLTTPNGIRLLTDPIQCDRPRVFTPVPSVAQIAAAQGTTMAQSVDIQLFLASGTWTKRAGAKVVHVKAMAGGGGGGSGRRGAAGTSRYGGGGAGGAGVGEWRYLASDLPASLPVTVGAAGTGGAAVTADNTDGNAGTGGGVSQFGGNSTSSFLGLRAGPGGGGGGGTAAAGTGGGSGASGTSGGSSSVSAAAGSSASPVPGNGGGGGGAGGGISAADVAFGGGSGFGSFEVPPYAGSSPGAAGGQNGGAAVARPAFAPGNGGGGGGGNAAGAGGNGGASQGAGGGGAGGGASLNGFNSGAGADGTPGYVLVVTHF